MALEENVRLILQDKKVGPHCSKQYLPSSQHHYRRYFWLPLEVSPTLQTAFHLLCRKEGRSTYCNCNKYQHFFSIFPDFFFSFLQPAFSLHIQKVAFLFV